MNPAGAPSTITGVLRARAEETPDRIAYRFLKDGEVEEAALSYAALDEKARTIAAWLQEAGAAGERAILLYPPGLDFVAAFFGCPYAGVVAWCRLPAAAEPCRPAHPGDRGRREGPLRPLTTESVRTTLEPRGGKVPGLDSLRWLATDTLPDGLRRSGARQTRRRRAGAPPVHIGSTLRRRA